MRALTVLERASLLLVLTGVSVVYAASTAFSPPGVGVSEFDQVGIGETVAVHGTVESVGRSGSTTFITLEEGGERLKAVYFGSSGVDVKEGEGVRLVGEASMYQGERELIISSVDR